ncbi:class I SAM-dependent methyltransferase [Actinoplanes couchii]|uniref:Methyltransferase type 12 domain-containing protein n=1 Tax=Actinoplanes couchii TaxID=403638 RepID=A0ABQ3XSD1_9ACTN|nr:class I SAM-dependent methyltransferase [Actinoplanes couchii]MDR6315941.1 SAM-dependent methyltransferase [Actinoplanes couchii]GID61409.1 hypothetical protein Aco03nite_098130 [Actinoplanes couchii]
MAEFDIRAGELCREFARTACPGSPEPGLSAAMTALRRSAAPQAAPGLALIDRILAEDESSGRAAGVNERSAPAIEDPMFRMLERCWVALPDFVSGRRTGVDLVFPQGDRRLWADLQAHSHHMSSYARLAVEAMLRLAPAGARILELGAGSGALTAEYVRRAENAAPSRYVMTDISPTFLRDARRRFTPGWMAYAPFDFTRPAAEQSLPPGRFDIVAGANAMHCAADVEAALLHSWSLVAPGGYLVLTEGARPADGRVWRPELIFALLPGWGQVSLGPHRADIGFLRPDEWSALVGRLPGATSVTLAIGHSTSQIIGSLVIARRHP